MTRANSTCFSDGGVRESSWLMKSLHAALLSAASRGIGSASCTTHAEGSATVPGRGVRGTRLLGEARGVADLLLCGRLLLGWQHRRQIDGGRDLPPRCRLAGGAKVVQVAALLVRVRQGQVVSVAVGRRQNHVVAE